MHNYSERVGGNLRRRDGRNIPAFSITQGDWLKLVARAMHEDAGPAQGAAKRIAAKVECAERTAQNWLDGETTPSGILDLRAMHALPAYAALKREIAAMEMNLDPRLQAKLMELYRMTQQLAAGE